MNDLGVGRNKNKEEENCLQILAVNLIGRTLKWFLVVVRTGFIWLRIGAYGRFLLTRQRILAFHKEDQLYRLHSITYILKEYDNLKSTEERFVFKLSRLVLN